MMQPPATILQGASGAGKTFSLPTLIQAGLELFVVCTEPGGPESLLDACEYYKAPVDKLHYTNVFPATGGWEALTELATTVTGSTYEQITNIKSGVGKSHHRGPLMHFLETVKNFKCERTGKEYGDVTSWGPDRAFALDSLTGFSLICWNAVVGYKPTANPGEWNIGMNTVHSFLQKLLYDRQCFMAMTAHVEKEVDEMTGVRRIMVSTLGSKLAPKLPCLFSEQVYCKRLIQNNQAKFIWSTLDSQADLKNRALPVAAELSPSFVPLVEAYQRRVKATGASPVAA